MTVRVERSFELSVPVERVWEFIADPEQRARAISVVTGYDTDGDTMTWHVRLPIPFVDTTVPVETEEVAREPPTFVKFVGRSTAMRVVGEHELEPTENGCRLTNRFVVDGRIPGVERYFKRQLDVELDNLETALRNEIGDER